MSKSHITARFFDDLSESDTDILTEVFREHGIATAAALQAEARRICQEWQAPDHDHPCKPITLESIFLAAGYTKEAASDQARHIREMNAIADYFDSMRAPS